MTTTPDEIKRLRVRVRGNIGPALVAASGGANIQKLTRFAYHIEMIEQEHIDKLKYYYTNHVRFGNQPKDFY